MSLITMVLSIDIIVMPLINHTVNDDLGYYLVLLLAPLIFYAILILMAMLRLEIKISEAGIAYRMFPLRKKYTSIPWDTVADIRLQYFNPLLKHGVGHQVPEKPGYFQPLWQGGHIIVS